LKQAHFVILPSESEGWPKILSEGMACGAVPVASDVSAIPQVLKRTKAGFALPRFDVSKFTQAILLSAQNPNEWKKLSLAGARASYLFTYEYYLLALNHMLATTYGSSPMDQSVIQATRVHLESRFGAGSIHL
jgi:glycosyltransferase involved in cell wall biosynthesis